MAIKAKALKKGDIVGIAAPASGFDRKRFDSGVAWFKNHGFKVRYSRKIFEKDLYLAGSDERRASELNSLIRDPEVAGIFFARGGYGSQRIMPLLDLSPLKENPKVIVGFSDLTPLLNTITNQINLITFYGPVVTQLSKGDGADKEMHHSFLNAITSKEPIGVLPLTNAVVIKEGTVRGTVVGGCLTLISTSIGTKYEVKTKDSILFLEDTDERIYSIDRMLTHLKNSGRLKGVKAILFGSLNLRKDEPAPDQLYTMLHKTLDDFPGPVIAGVPVGHSKPFLTMPIGVSVSVSTNPLKITIEEAALV